MEFGVHLPLLAFRRQAFSLSRLLDYAETMEQLGFTTLCANDHLTFSRPWLDSCKVRSRIGSGANSDTGGEVKGRLDLIH